jgi:hypothetical protein
MGVYIYINMKIQIENHSPIAIHLLKNGKVVIIDKWGTVWDKEVFLNACQDCIVTEMVNHLKPTAI